MERWEREILYFEGDAYFDALIEGISHARRTLKLEFYTLDDDDVGRRVTEALLAASRRGVHVRLLVDGVGSWPWILSGAYRALLEAFEIRVYHPLPFMLRPRAWSLRQQVAGLVESWAHVNARDHRKVCLIDRERAWVGSFNLSAVHSRRSRGELAWRDSGAHVVGPGVELLRQAFLRAWQQASVLTDGPSAERRKLQQETLFPFERAPSLPTRVQRRLVALQATLAERLRHPARIEKEMRLAHAPQVRVFSGRRGRRRAYRDLLQRFSQATGRIWLSTAYFVPSGSLLRALSYAAARGVDVRVIVSARSDVVFFPWVSMAFYLALLRAGVAIHEYRPSILHAKTVIVDDWMIVGSTNINHRSLFLDLEADVRVTSSEGQEAMLQALERDLSVCTPIDFQWVRARPTYHFWIARFLLLFRRLM